MKIGTARVPSIAIAAQIALTVALLQTGILVPSRAAAAVAAAAASPAGAAPLAAEHRRLMDLVQGGTVMVAASPALCEAVGARMPGPPPALRERYFRTGACMLPFRIDHLGVVTRATQGLDADLLDPSKVDALRAVLAEIRTRLGEANAQERLMFHSTAWELLHAIDAPAVASAAPSLDVLRCETMALLRASSYTLEEAAALPSTLGRLPELAGVEEIADLAERIERGDPEIVELLPPPEAHARLLHGRFTLRVFFTGSTPEARQRVGDYLRDTPYEAQGRLPLEVPDVVSVLLLYFNVLDRDLQIIPTSQIAFWQQYAFRGRLTLDRDELEQAEETVRFVSIRYQRNYETDEPRYALLDESAMSRTGFVDGMPSAMSAPVTTLRGACIRCHRRVVSSFHPEETREVRLTRPLEVSGRELLTPAYTAGTEARFQQWAARCPR